MKNRDRKHDIKNKKLLIINTGSIKKKFIFQKLKKMGLELVVLNKEKNWITPYADDWILADTANHTECIQAVGEYLQAHKDSKPDGIITFWEDDVLLTAKLSDRYNFIGIPYRVAQKARNKFLFREFCQKNGIDTPAHKLLNSTRDLNNAIRTMTFPLVVKPVFGSSSAYVIKVENAEELTDAYQYIRKNMTVSIESALTDGNEILVEDYIDGEEVDIDIVLQNGKVKFFSISDNDQTNEPFFIETGQSIPSSLPADDQQALIDLAEKTLELMGVQNGVIHFEAKSTIDGPVPIEVNLRMGGDEVCAFVREAWGVDLVEQAAKIALGVYIPKIYRSSKPLRYMIGKYFLSDHSGILVSTDIDREIKKKPYLKELYFFKQIGDPVLVPPDGYDHLGWATVAGDNPNDAKDNLDDAFRHVKYSVAKFDADSSLGKTSRRNRFSSAVVTKDALLKSAKLKHISALSRKDTHAIHVGLWGTPEKKVPGNGKAKPSESTQIRSVLEDRGYNVSLIEADNIERTVRQLKSSDIDLVYNIGGSISSAPSKLSQDASLLDAMNIPYTGSNHLTLALCSDKIIVKKMLEFHEIPTPKWDCAYEINEEIREDLKYPLIVKPSGTDNSFGITNNSVVTDKKQLRKQLEFVLKDLNQPALIEEYIDGDEYDVCILGSDYDDYQVLPLSRTIFKDLPRGYWHIYTYEAKWKHKKVYDNIQVQRPAKNIGRRLEQLITEIALDAYAIVSCLDYGRVEIRVDRDNNPYVLEVNPNPSLSKQACLPLVAKFVDMDYPDLIEAIMHSAISRYRKSNESLKPHENIYFTK